MAQKLVKSDELMRVLSIAEADSRRMEHSCVISEFLLSALGQAYSEQSLGEWPTCLPFDEDTVDAAMNCWDFHAEEYDNTGYSQDAFQALEFAQEEAVLAGDEFVRPGHLLVGLLRADNTIVKEALEQLLLPRYMNPERLRLLFKRQPSLFEPAGF